jgi:V8-like Glu-specific endopeptidase
MSVHRFATPLIALAAILTGCSMDRSTEPTELGAQFITFGSIDENNTYSNVGAFIVKSPTTGQLSPLCSGTLISEAAFLTAAHCTAYFEHTLAPLGWTAFVSFDNPIPYGELTTRRTKLIAVADVVTNPAYSQRQSDSGDIGVLVLPTSQTHGITPATLPAAGLLDRLAAENGLENGVFTAVGYGVHV